MPDLKTEIQGFIDFGASPITADEVFARVDTVKVGPVGRRPSRQHRRFGASMAIVAAAATVIAVVSLVLPEGKHGLDVAPASAATVLESAAARAQSEPPLVPGPGQFLYARSLVSFGDVLSTMSGALVSLYIQDVEQTWTSPTALGNLQWQVVGQPQFVTGRDRAAWVAEGSPPLQSGYVGGGSTPYYDVAGLPTDPSRIGPYLASQSDLAPAAATGRNSAWQFTTAASFLQNGASARQRSALLRFMATIPGVRLAGRATTVGTHRHGTALAIPSDFNGLSVEAILDRRTSDLLEVRYVVTDATAYAKATPGFVGEVLASGQVRNYVDFLFAGIASSSTSVPSDAPILPAPWPYGSSREPLPGSLYP